MVPVGLTLAERGPSLAEHAGELLSALRHTKAFGGRPLLDFGAGECDPTLDALEHLDLEGCEQHGQVGALGEGVAVVEVRRHELHHRVVSFGNVRPQFVKSTMEVVDRSVVGEQQSEEGFYLNVRWLGSCPGPPLERGATSAGYLVDVAGPVADPLFVGGGVTKFDELLWLGIEETLRFGPGVAKTALRLVGEFVARPGFEVEEGKDCI